MIAAGFEAAEAAATDAVADLVAELGIEAGGVVVGRGVRRMPLERIFASSQLFHSAEGEVYQQALRAALANAGVPATKIAFATAERHECWPVVEALGRDIGPPWRKDHKFAAVAAWVAATALAESSP